MASNNPGYCLFRDVKGFDLSGLPEPYRLWHKTSTDPGVMSVHNTARTRATLHRYTIEALLAWSAGSNSPIGAVRMAEGSYASEWRRPDGSALIAHATANGVLSACIRDPLTGRTRQLPGIGSSSTEFNDAGILLLYLLIEADISAANGAAAGCVTHSLLQACRDEYQAKGVLPEDWVRLVCDDVYHAVSGGTIPVNIRSGNVALLTERRLSSNEFATGTVVCGQPEILKCGAADAGPQPDGGRPTVGQARKLAKEYTDTLHWSAEEEAMIPQFDEETEVPPEVMTILRRFLQSRKWRNPMNNPCWRGSATCSAYKSAG